MLNNHMLLSAEAQESDMQGSVITPCNSVYIVDVHAVSSTLILRKSYSIHRTGGAWTAGTGLCSLLGQRDELLKGVVCVVYIRSPTIQAMTAAFRSNAHALHADVLRRPRQTDVQQ